MNVSMDFRDNATPTVERLMEKVSPKRLGAIVMPACREFWRDRLRSQIYDRAAPKSTKSSKREAWARSVIGVVSDEGMTLSAGDDKAAIGLRQRYYGGQIPRGGPRAGPSGKLLTIPINPIAEGKRAREFPDAFLFKRKGRLYIAQRKDKKSQRLTFLFIVVGTVFQEGNPQVVPTNDEFAEICLARITQAIKEKT